MSRFWAIFLLPVFLFSLIISTGCVNPDEKTEINIESLLGGLGLTSSIFEEEPQTQLGTLVFYRSERVVKELCERFQFKGTSDYAIQISGKLAQDILDHLAYFSKGTLKSDEAGVVYLFGEIAQDLYQELHSIFTIDDIFYFEGKEMVVVSGAEALSLLGFAKEKLAIYYAQTPQKVERVFVASYEDARQWTKNFLLEFYEDLSIGFSTNPVKVVDALADVGHFGLGGIGRVILLTGEIWVISFDSVSKLGAFLTGGELIPESILIRKTVKGAAEIGYLVASDVSEIFRMASGEKRHGFIETENGGILTNPLITIDIASQTLRNATFTSDAVVHYASEMTIGYISDNLELLGEFLNLAHENIVGDLLIFVGDSLSRGIHITSLGLRAIIHLGGNSVSALVGAFSFEKPLDAKLTHRKNIWDVFRDDMIGLWHELMKFLRLR